MPVDTRLEGDANNAHIAVDFLLDFVAAAAAAVLPTGQRTVVNGARRRRPTRTVWAGSVVVTIFVVGEETNALLFAPGRENGLVKCGLIETAKSLGKAE